MIKIIKLRTAIEAETFLNKNKVTFLQLIETKTGWFLLVCKTKLFSK
jgi:hypothetical protein